MKTRVIGKVDKQLQHLFMQVSAGVYRTYWVT